MTKGVKETAMSNGTVGQDHARPEVHESSLVVQQRKQGSIISHVF